MRLRKIILRMQFGAKDFFHLQREVSYIIVTGRPLFETFNTNYDEQKHILFYFKMAHPSPCMHLWNSWPTLDIFTSPHRLWLPTSEVVSAHLVYQNVLLLEDVPSDQMRSSHRGGSISVKLTTSKKRCLTQKHQHFSDAMERTGWFHLHYHYHTNFRSQHVLVAEDVGIRLEGCPTRKRYLLMRFAYAIKWWTLGIQWRKRRMTIKIIKQTTGYQWISIPFQWNDVSPCGTLSHPPPESWKAAFSGGWEDCQTEGWSAAESGLTALTLHTQWAGFHGWRLVTLVARGRWKFPGCRAFQLFWPRAFRALEVGVERSFSAGRNGVWSVKVI